jgi:hypothetical protein
MKYNLFTPSLLYLDVHLLAIEKPRQRVLAWLLSDLRYALWQTKLSGEEELGPVKSEPRTLTLDTLLNNRKNMSLAP